MSPTTEPSLFSSSSAPTASVTSIVSRSSLHKAKNPRHFLRAPQNVKLCKRMQRKLFTQCGSVVGNLPYTSPLLIPSKKSLGEQDGMATATVRVGAATGVSSLSHRDSGTYNAPSRMPSVDMLRGAAMVLMALDHTRRFFTGATFSPENLAHTSGALFFTRFVTHFCAPIFFFLAGASMFLAVSRGKSRTQISRYLWTRGAWLVLLDFTLIGYGWASVFPFPHAGVVWTLGWSMILLALVVYLPQPLIAALGVGIIAFHNLFDGVDPASFGKFSLVWLLLHRPGEFQIRPRTLPFLVSFPLLPWFGVMVAGYAFGAILLRPDRRKILFTIGAALAIAFLVLRGFGLYGNVTAGLQQVYSDSAGP